MMIRPELSDSIMGMILKDDEPDGDLTAAEWIRTYVDLGGDIVGCDDDDALWLLARAMVKDANASDCGEGDAGDMMEVLIRHRYGGQGRAEKAA